MSEKKSLVEDTLIQMRNLEEAIQENAKGILASTMKEEISDLVKESLNETETEEEMDEMEMESKTDDKVDEQESSDLEMDMDMEDEVSDESEEESDEDSEEMMGAEMNLDMDVEDEVPMDLTNASTEELLKVFKAMGEEDGIIVKKEDDKIHLKDDSEGVEYMIDLGESINEQPLDLGDESEEEEFDFNLDDESEDEEFEFDEFEERMPMRKSHRIRKMKRDEEMHEQSFADETESEKQADIDAMLDDIFNESEVSEEEEVVYEIELDEEDDNEDMTEETEETDEEMNETYDLEEAFKPKMFKGKNPENKTNKGPKKMLMKKPTGKMFGMTPKIGKTTKTSESDVKKVETKEAARTLGMGSKFRKGGLPKPKAAPRHLGEDFDFEAMNAELVSLREKNEEYRKALNIFREKLNEVAIFNSNLAYATRLFTEHSTSKQEKINILRRFDGVETIKESKNLYTTIKEELSSKGVTPITESIESKIEKTPSSGSAANLIESKTYENPQFLRMKDLMNKIK
jgi:hypothetical protein